MLGGDRSRARAAAARARAARCERACRLPCGDAPAWLEAAWLAFAALALLAVWVGALAPDVSWDALAYHLPEARDIARARTGRRAAGSRCPTRCSGATTTRISRSASSTEASGSCNCCSSRSAPPCSARPSRWRGASRPAARPRSSSSRSPRSRTAMLQLRATYVDWPAALLVTAAARRVRGGPAARGRLRLAGVSLRRRRRHQGLRALRGARASRSSSGARVRARAAQMAGALACTLAALAARGWSGARGARARSWRRTPPRPRELVASGRERALLSDPSPASGVAAPPRCGGRSPGAPSPRCPTISSSTRAASKRTATATTASSCWSCSSGWPGGTPGGVALFCVAALPFLVPWSLLYLPSIRYPLPGLSALRRLLRRGTAAADAAASRARWGAAAGVALLGAAAAFPVQLGSSGVEWRVAVRADSRASRASRRGFRATASGRAWCAPEDRVLFVGENDRFHCPAALAWRAEYLPAAAWGRDPAAWRAGLDGLGITHVLHRDGPAPGRAARPALARPARAGRPGRARPCSIGCGATGRSGSRAAVEWRSSDPSDDGADPLSAKRAPRPSSVAGGAARRGGPAVSTPRGA